MSKRVWGFIVKTGGLPDRVIRDAELIIAFGFLVLGALTVSPWYPRELPTVVNYGLTDVHRSGVPISYILSCILIIWGKTTKRRWAKRFGLLGLTLALLYGTLFRLIVFGPYPLHWLPVLITCLIVARFYTYEVLRG